MKTEITKLILYAISLAMGVAGIVLSSFGESQATIGTLFGIAIFCLALAGLNSVKTDKL